MPMILRDGKLYKSRSSEHMLLRDGKIVDEDQSLVYDQVYENRNVYLDWHNASRDSDTSDTLNLSHEANSRRRSGRSEKLNNARKLDHSTTEERTEGQSKTGPWPRAKADNLQSSPISEDKVIFLDIGLHFSKPRPLQAPSLRNNNTFEAQSNQPKHLKNMDAISEDDSGFLTSTPTICDSNSSAQKFEFTKIQRISTSVSTTETVIRDGIKIANKKNSRTSVGTKVLTTPVRKSTRPKFDSFDTESDADEGLEQYVFQDLSKSLMYGDNPLDPKFDETDYHQHQKETSSQESQVRYRVPSTPSGQEIIAFPRLDHPKWSEHHHWRREWYLNRWRGFSSEREKLNWVQRIIRTVYISVISVFVFLSSWVAYITDHVSYIWHLARGGSVVKSSTTRYISVIQRRQNVKKKRKAFGFLLLCCYLIACLLLLLILVALPFMMYFVFCPDCQYYAPSPQEVGINNANSTFVSGSKGTMPAWHIFPAKAVKFNGDSFDDGYPVIFHIRKSGYLASEHRVEVFKALSSLGYHVLIPSFAGMPKADMIEAWKWLRNRTKSPNVYLWGDLVEAKFMSDLSKDLCRKVLPPTGVVIEMEAVNIKSQVRSIEIWSCNCTTVNNQNGLPYNYGHVKCPLHTNRLYDDILECLQALRKD